MFTGSDSAIIIKEEDLGNLSCHKCEENFKQQWDPYTVCQIQPNNTPLIPCLRSETYCMVSPAKTLITDKYLGVQIPIPSFPWNLQSYQIDIVNPQEIQVGPKPPDPYQLVCKIRGICMYVKYIKVHQFPSIFKINFVY